MSTIFTIVGAIIGAGFISGKELVRFFGGNAVIPIYIFTFVILTLYLFLFLSAGKKWGGFQRFLSERFGKWQTLVKIIFLLSSFVIVTSMLAGINALAIKFSPFIAILMAIICFFIAKKGMKGVRIFSTFLVPVIVLYVIISLINAGRFVLLKTPLNVGMGTLFAWLYVALNLFLSAPVVMDLGRDLQNKKQIVCSSIGSATIIVVCIVLITLSINAVAGAEDKTIPLLFILEDGKIFPFVSFLAIVTTLISSYYPVHTVHENTSKKDAVRLIILAAASLLSLWGLDGIVNTVYPVIGVLGIVFSAFLVFDGQFFNQRNDKIHHARQSA